MYFMESTVIVYIDTHEFKILGATPPRTFNKYNGTIGVAITFPNNCHIIK